MAEKGGRQERLSPDYAANVRMMDDILRVRDNFDVIRKDMQIGRDRITLYYIDGFVKDSVMEKLMIFFLSLKRLVPEESGAPGEWPTSSLKAQERNSPQSQKETVGSIVIR